MCVPPLFFMRERKEVLSNKLVSEFLEQSVIIVMRRRRRRTNSTPFPDLRLLLAGWGYQKPDPGAHPSTDGCYTERISPDYYRRCSDQVWV